MKTVLAQGVEVGAGVEPAHGGFADRGVPISPTHHGAIIVLATVLGHQLRDGDVVGVGKPFWR